MQTFSFSLEPVYFAFKSLLRTWEEPKSHPSPAWMRTQSESVEKPYEKKNKKTVTTSGPVLLPPVYQVLFLHHLLQVRLRPTKLAPSDCFLHGVWLGHKRQQQGAYTQDITDVSQRLPTIFGVIQEMWDWSQLIVKNCWHRTFSQKAPRSWHRVHQKNTCIAETKIVPWNGTIIPLIQSFLEMRTCDTAAPQFL